MHIIPGPPEGDPHVVDPVLLGIEQEAFVVVDPAAMRFEGVAGLVERDPHVDLVDVAVLATRIDGHGRATALQLCPFKLVDIGELERLDAAEAHDL